MSKSRPKSLYSGKEAPKKLPVCRTAAELLAVLKELPPDLPIRPSDGGVLPIWFNVGCEGRKSNGEHLGFDDPEIWYGCG